MKEQSEATQTGNRYYGVGGIHAVVAFFANYVNFTGRSTRREYWWFQLWNYLFAVIVYGGLLLTLFGSWRQLLTGSTPELQGGQIAVLLVLIVLLFVVSIGLFVPSLALAVRRYRDAGIHWGVFIAVQAVSFVAAMSLELVHGWPVIVLAVIVVVIWLVNFVITVLPSKPLSSAA
ncbi:MAG: DUF805 domain-containing protein [Lactobacillus sp.]|jgi:uncharacterized membrane protein YhaH (DUF805 family)|nr:DUF805 domain-containing protein [Lactobacillus sp.]MCI2031832.1 DUF805 domain-containing protein [Lactobacillus sp.]